MYDDFWNWHYEHFPKCAYMTYSVWKMRTESKKKKQIIIKTKTIEKKDYFVIHWAVSTCDDHDMIRKKQATWKHTLHHSVNSSMLWLLKGKVQQNHCKRSWCISFGLVLLYHDIVSKRSSVCWRRFHLAHSKQTFFSPLI